MRIVGDNTRIIDDRPLVEATIAIKSGKPQAAIEALKVAQPYQGAYPTVPFSRGLAYFAMKRPLPNSPP